MTRIFGRRRQEEPIETLDRETLIARVGQTRGPHATPSPLDPEDGSPRHDAPESAVERVWRRALQQPR